MRVVLAGGGSAGHIEPALALADALRQADGSIEVTCLGTQRGLETRLVPLRGYELELIPAVPLPRSVTPQLLTVPGRLAGAVHAVGTILERVGADVLVGFGGYVATPAYLAAKRHRVPIVVHEANPLAGIANRLGAHLTTHVFTGHPDTKLRNGKYLGIPIRRQIAELDRFALGDKARAHFGLRPDLPVLLVTGGSQGAVSLNRALAGAVSAITSAGVQVLHITGPKHLNEIQAPPGPVPYVAVPYVDRMDLAYAAADFALCRGGAMTCAELTAVGLPAAYVPLPHGNGEQRLNALPIVQRGGGLLVDDAELTADWIKSSLLPVLTNIDQVAGMSEAAAAMGRKDADRWLAKAVIDIVTAEAAKRVAEAGQNPAAARQPAPRPAPAPAGQWASPAPQPQPQPQPPAPAPAPQEQPGSLFTPRSTRHQQGASGPQQQVPGAPGRPDSGQRAAGNRQDAGWPLGADWLPSGSQGSERTQPPAEGPRQARGQDARGPFQPGQSPARPGQPQPGQSPAGPGQPQPGQRSTRPVPPGQSAAGQAPSARPPQPSYTPTPAQPRPASSQLPPSQPGQERPNPSPTPAPTPTPTPAPTPSPSPGPGRHRQARS
jgi:UDP-N-acetylglucosamine--N-acetylmuramyl-(pentapeptide) pyrophosphoryl-undecaprenol N-acetylglucosamine transferase